MSGNNRFKKSLDNLDTSEVQYNIPEKNNIITNGETNISGNINSNILTDILSNISVKEPQGKSVALYLSSEIDEIIAKIAKQKGVSKSKLVDSVLRQVFLQKK